MKQRHKQEHNKTQTRKQITEQGQKTRTQQDPNKNETRRKQERK